MTDVDRRRAERAANVGDPEAAFRQARLTCRAEGHDVSEDEVRRFQGHILQRAMLRICWRCGETIEFVRKSDWSEGLGVPPREQYPRPRRL